MCLIADTPHCAVLPVRSMHVLYYGAKKTSSSNTYLSSYIVVVHINLLHINLYII